MTFRTIEFDVDGAVAVVALNRPDILNPLNEEIIVELRQALAQVDADSSIRALVLTGRGRGFCAGADLKDGLMGGSNESAGERVAQSMDRHFNALIRDLRALRAPTVAAVNGVAAGGGASLALVLDIVIAARSARFIQVFTPRLGLVPDMGSCWLLARLAGRSRALGLAMLGDTLSAEQAKDWGLIWACVDDGALMDEAMAVARRLASGPTQAYAAVRRTVDAAFTQSLDAVLDAERDCQRVLIDTADFREALSAFREKREPVFGGA